MSKDNSENTEEENTFRNNIESNIGSSSNFDFKFYPPIKDFYDNESQYDIYNKNEPNFLHNGINEKIKFDNEIDTYEINQDFFESLIRPKNQFLNKEKKINTISKIIRKSKLMEKLEKEFSDSNKKIDLCALSYKCAKNLLFMELKKGKVLFRIGDKGDRFYFILSGKITILKPRKIISKMNLKQYLSYLSILIKEKEDYLFQEVILNNCTQIPITSVDEIKSLYKIFFSFELESYIENGKINNNKQLKIFFEEKGQIFDDYDIDKKKLEILEAKKKKLISNREWYDYILDKCIMAKGNIDMLRRYRQFYDKINVVCYLYDPFLYLGPGFFFGDAALDQKINKRNATIRAEENCVLGFLKIVDYSYMIAPQRKIEKMNEINFLINNFFFKNINTTYFEKNLFHHFSLIEYNRGAILFNCGSIPKNIIFLKEGGLSLTIRCSIIDINKIIEKICNKVINQYSDELIQKKVITKNKINLLKGYTQEDDVLSKLNGYSKEFIKEIDKKRNFKIAVFSAVETIGLEEIFLDIPYITEGVVTSEKIVCYILGVEKMKSMLIENNHINYYYLKSSINKIFSLIERLRNLKQNWIDISKMRFESQNSFRNKFLPNIKNSKLIFLSQNNKGKFVSSEQNSNASILPIKTLRMRIISNPCAH